MLFNEQYETYRHIFDQPNATTSYHAFSSAEYLDEEELDVVLINICFRADILEARHNDSVIA